MKQSGNGLQGTVKHDLQLIERELQSVKGRVTEGLDLIGGGQETSAAESDAASRIGKEGINVAQRTAGIVARAVRNQSVQAAKQGRGNAAGSSWMDTSAHVQSTEGGIVQQKREYVSKKGLANLSYGDPERMSGSGPATSGKARMIRAADRGKASGAAIKQQATKRQAAAAAAKVAQKQAAAQAAAKAAGGAGKSIGQALAATGKGIAGMGAGIVPILVILAVIMVVFVVAWILSATMASPLGFFFSDNSAGNPYSVNNIVSRVGDAWDDRLAAVRQQYESQKYIVTVDYNVGGSGDSLGRVNNWKDALALYVIRKNDQSNTVVHLDAADEEAIRSLYFDMNPINVSTRTEQVEHEVQKEVTEYEEHDYYAVNPATGKQEKYVSYVLVTRTVTEKEIKEVKYADISVANLRYVQVLDKYPLTVEQAKSVDFLLGPDMSSAWSGLLGIEFGGQYLNNEAIKIILHDLPEGSAGKAIVQAAFTRLGDPYSMDLRGTGSYVDCSYLVQWAYAQAGLSIPGTAAEQARYCVSAGKTIAAGALQPGDLMFWTYPDNPRVKNSFMQIGHVAIFVGNGMMIEASPSAGGVVYRSASAQGTPVLYARPYV